MKENFLIQIETWHKPDLGEQENVSEILSVRVRFCVDTFVGKKLHTVNFLELHNPPLLLSNSLPPHGL